MTRTLAAAACIGAAIILTGAARADEFAIKLKPGVGLEQTQTHCAACHSLDYIVMNSPFPTAKVWDAEVTKMIKAFGANIPPDEAKAITDYLAKNYGS